MSAAPEQYFNQEAYDRAKEQTGLRATEKFVLIALSFFAESEGHCPLTMEELCQKTSMSRRGVQKNLSRLIEKALVQRICISGRPSRLYVQRTDGTFAEPPLNHARLFAVKKDPRRRTVSPRVRFMVFNRDEFTCQYCGFSAPFVTLEIDHVVPVAAGGSNKIDNLMTACTVCNAGKSNLLVGGVQ